MKPSEFLEMLWGERPEGKALLWTLPNKLSTWFLDWSHVDSWVEAQEGRDTYTGVALAAIDARVTSGTRVSNATAAGLGALWADIDIADPVHQKTNLPPSLEVAEEMLAEAAPPPSILIHSGHGYQAWWLFERPWIFTSEDDRHKAAAMARQWQSQIAQVFSRRGYTMDSTVDLARVMRVPGSWNHKATPVLVQVVQVNETRLSVAELLSQVPPEIHTNGHTPVELPAASPDAQPPFDKFTALMESDQKFRRTWEHRRPDLNDQSTSSYDMSLANLSALAGWNKAEIQALLIAHRRKYGADMKLRESYYGPTISKALRPEDERQAQERLEEALDSDVEDKRETLVENLSTLFGVEIHNIVKYLGDPPTYTMETNGGLITLGKVDTIMNQNAFRKAIAATTGKVIPKCKDPLWDKRAQAILDACEERADTDLASPQTETRSWLAEYLRDWEPIDDVDNAARHGSPFIKDGHAYITRTEFRKWLDSYLHIRVDDAAMSRRLNQIGWEQHTIAYTNAKGVRTTRSYYRGEPSFNTRDEKVLETFSSEKTVKQLNS